MEGVPHSGSSHGGTTLSDFLRQANLSELEPLFAEEGFTELDDIIEAEFEELEPILTDRVQRGKIVRFRGKHKKLRNGPGNDEHDVKRLLKLIHDLTKMQEQLGNIQTQHSVKKEELKQEIADVFDSIREYLDREQERLSNVVDEIDEVDVEHVKTEVDEALTECLQSKEAIEKVYVDMNRLEQFAERQTKVDGMMRKCLGFEALVERKIHVPKMKLNVYCVVDVTSPFGQIEMLGEKLIDVRSTLGTIEWNPMEGVDACIVQMGVFEEKQENDDDVTIIESLTFGIDVREMNLLEWMKNTNINEDVVRVRVMGTTHDGIVVVAKSKWVDIVMQDPFESVIINGVEGITIAKYVAETMNRECSFELLHRASTHGDGADVFHRNCDQRGITIVIISDEWGNVFGGFNMINWESPSSGGVFVSSTANWLFLVRSAQGKHVPKKFIVKRGKEQYAAINNGGYGPTFGGGHDIYISSNCRSNKSSHSNFGHTYENEGDSRYLTNQQKFKVSDYEVFAVKA